MNGHKVAFEMTVKGEFSNCVLFNLLFCLFGQFINVKVVHNYEILLFEQVFIKVKMVHES